MWQCVSVRMAAIGSLGGVHLARWVPWVRQKVAVRAEGGWEGERWVLAHICVVHAGVYSRCMQSGNKREKENWGERGRRESILQ